MARQLFQFSPLLASVSEPFWHQLSTKNAWKVHHQTAFNMVKKVVPEPPILSHFEIKKPTNLWTDSSQLNGISIIIYQKHDNKFWLIVCTSWFLTQTTVLVPSFLVYLQCVFFLWNHVSQDYMKKVLIKVAPALICSINLMMQTDSLVLFIQPVPIYSNHFFLSIRNLKQSSHYEERDWAHAPCRTPQLACGA